ncbi:MAG: MarR family transcriptional regulator [Candidatus Odinarchaeota archaeon]
MATAAQYETSSPLKDLAVLPKSARHIYGVLKSEGPMKPGLIKTKTDLSARTVRYGLKKLVDYKFVGRFPDLEDLRSHYYKLL